MIFRSLNADIYEVAAPSPYPDLAQNEYHEWFDQHRPVLESMIRRLPEKQASTLARLLGLDNGEPVLATQIAQDEDVTKPAVSKRLRLAQRKLKQLAGQSMESN